MHDEQRSKYAEERKEIVRQRLIEMRTQTDKQIDTVLTIMHASVHTSLSPSIVWQKFFAFITDLSFTFNTEQMPDKCALNCGHHANDITDSLI